MADDPLRLRALAARTIRATHRLVDADRVVLRAFARIAHEVTASGPPRARAWIERQVEGAVDDVLAAERAAVRAGDDGDDEDRRDAYAVIATPLGLTGRGMRRACDAFNRRSDEERAAFFSLVVEARGIDGAARDQGTDASTVARRARSALEAMVAACGEEEEGVAPR